MANIYIDMSLIRQCKAKGINISKTCREALENALGLVKDVSSDNDVNNYIKAWEDLERREIQNKQNQKKEAVLNKVQDLNSYLNKLIKLHKETMQTGDIELGREYVVKISYIQSKIKELKEEVKQYE